MSQPVSPPDSPLFHNLWSAQRGRCALCGKTMPASRYAVPHATVWKRERPTFDHIVPRSAGGPDRIENFQLAHARCNKRKGDRQAVSVGRDRT